MPWPFLSSGHMKTNKILIAVKNLWDNIVWSGLRLRKILGSHLERRCVSHFVYMTFSQNHLLKPNGTVLENRGFEVGTTWIWHLAAWLGSSVTGNTSISLTGFPSSVCEGTEWDHVFKLTASCNIECSLGVCYNFIITIIVIFFCFAITTIPG